MVAIITSGTFPFLFDISPLSHVCYRELRPKNGYLPTNSTSGQLDRERNVGLAVRDVGNPTESAGFCPIGIPVGGRVYFMMCLNSILH